MTLMERLNDDMKVAMRAKDKEVLSVIRMLKASVQKEEIEVGRSLNADEELTILARELKQRKDSVREFTAANRDDLATKTAFEIEVVERYLPKQLSIEEVQSIVEEVIAQVGASSPSDFGKVMGVIMPRVKGQADGNVINQVVKAALNRE